MSVGGRSQAKSQRPGKSQRLGKSQNPGKTQTGDGLKPADEVPSAAIAAGIKAYNRSRDLPRLLCLWPHEVEDSSVASGLKLLETLRRALRAEKRRADAGHWGYDLNRHLALLCAYKSERIALAESGTLPSCTAAREGFEPAASD